MQKQLRRALEENARLKSGNRKQPHEAVEWLIENKCMPLLNAAKQKLLAPVSATVQYHMIGTSKTPTGHGKV